MSNGKFKNQLFSDCEVRMLHIFLGSQGTQTSIFSFAVFISALALLSIIYTVTDVRFRFRVAVAPIPLHGITYFLIALIGIGTLVTDVWFAENWLIPNFLNDQLIWQGIFGATFLGLVLIWIYYAFINPPIFSRYNYKKFINVFYSMLIKGSDSELPVLANELARSSTSVVRLSNEIQRKSFSDLDGNNRKFSNNNIGKYAHDFLLLIGNRKLCRNIIASSPVTAIAFFQAMVEKQKYDIPIGQFSKNISTEALINRDSILYHEDEGYSSGLIGYIKPFSQAIYGNYLLVEALAKNNGSPLDMHYELVSSWDAAQLEAYCRCVLITFKSYIQSGSWPQHSYALYRAFEKIKDSCRDIYKLNDTPLDYPTDISKRLHVTVDFVKDIIDFLDKEKNLPTGKLRIHEHTQKSFYDHIANLMFEIIFSASAVKSPPDRCWGIHYITVWDQFFNSFTQGRAWKIINYKLRRLLYDEICQLDKFPNYKSSRILGFCLNVMGLNLGDRKVYRSDYPLHKAVIKWTKINYLRLRTANVEVAESCLIGSISFDTQNNRLVKIYAKGLKPEPYKEFMPLI